MVEAISGEKPARQAILGDASNRNENSGILASCLLAGGVLFRPLAIRCDVFPGHRGYDTPGSQKAPSAKRCIKTVGVHLVEVPVVRRQKAPSAKRCIKTRRCAVRGSRCWRQKAPSAKRCIKTGRSPSRRSGGNDGSESTERQKVH